LSRIVSCVSRAILIRGRNGPADSEFFTLSDRFVPISGRFALDLSIIHTCAIRRIEGSGEWKAQTAGYLYQIRQRAGPELIAFHWHPGRIGLPDFPHLHLEASSTDVLSRKAHIPTGLVTLAACVRFLIDELDVRPLRTDWQRLLDEADQADVP
jgi:hypothetical protein